MTDIDVIVKDLDELISSVINTKKYTSIRNTIPLLSLINIAVNFNVQRLDNSDDDVAPEQKLYPPLEQVEPIIDVFDGEKSLKITSLIPGVKKEDITFNIEDGFIDLEIRKDGQIYHKQIPCNIKPHNVTVTTTYNNSVLEIIFDKI